jgi:hypothetical protein
VFPGEAVEETEILETVAVLVEIFDDDLLDR